MCKDSDEFQQQSAHPFSLPVLPSKRESMAGGALSASCLPRHRCQRSEGLVLNRGFALQNRTRAAFHTKTLTHMVLV